MNTNEEKELEYIRMEADEIDASDKYFEARPQIDGNDRRNVFKAGFERGYKAGRAIRAESEPVWMPIETAPKDGTNIIVTNGETVSVGWWVEDDDYQEWLDIDGGMLPEPTLWKPLLTAPQTLPESKLVEALKDFTDAVEKVAFSMPAPNTHTPRLMELCVAAREIICQHGAQTFEREDHD